MAEEKKEGIKLGVPKVVSGNPSPFRPALPTLKVNENPLPQDLLFPQDSPHHV